MADLESKQAAPVYRKCAAAEGLGDEAFSGSANQWGRGG